MPTNQTTDNTYSEKLKDPRWQKKRLEIFQRDNWTCQKCGDTTSPLAVHHKHYLNGYEPWEYPESLLITFCEKCHEEEHAKLQEALDFLTSQIQLNFSADEIVRIAQGFEKVSLHNDTMAIAFSIFYALSVPELQDFLVNFCFAPAVNNSQGEKHG